MDSFQELVRQFRQHGYKITPQRRAILQVVADSTTHPTAEQIYERVSKCRPETSLATVYNTLRELVAIDQVYELDLGLGGRRYERSRVAHAHLVCLGCGRIEDAALDSEAIKVMLSHTDGFSPTLLSVNVFGYCADCAASMDLP